MRGGAASVFIQPQVLREPLTTKPAGSMLEVVGANRLAQRRLPVPLTSLPALSALEATSEDLLVVSLVVLGGRGDSHMLASTAGLGGMTEDALRRQTE